MHVLYVSLRNPKKHFVFWLQTKLWVTRGKTFTACYSTVQCLNSLHMKGCVPSQRYWDITSHTTLSHSRIDGYLFPLFHSVLEINPLKTTTLRCGYVCVNAVSCIMLCLEPGSFPKPAGITWWWWYGEGRGGEGIWKTVFSVFLTRNAFAEVPRFWKPELHWQAAGDTLNWGK